jgi:hypothetical protein
MKGEADASWAQVRFSLVTASPANILLKNSRRRIGLFKSRDPRSVNRIRAE